MTNIINLFIMFSKNWVFNQWEITLGKYCFWKKKKKVIYLGTNFVFTYA